MEGNVEDLNLKAINASVGRLVWVRLRNASWWPGQTLLLDQVPHNSPNVGTPIKLLGRDDVNVEWYILEKSKSVKAFRCGEYDAHIDKAKAAAAARASKKRTAKFTRREIAIHIALEIENSHLPKQDHHSEAEDGLGSAPDPSISFQETNNVAKVQQPKRRRTPNDSEDDGTEGTKRMRGLEDIGKEHVGAIVVFNNGQDVGLNCVADSVSNGDKACSPLSLKRKRSQVINANECSSKKKNRRRQLTKVLESTAMVSEQLVTSGMEPVESMKSVSAVINNSSDSTCENASENVVGASHYNKAKDSDISSLSVSAEDDDPSDQLLHDVPLIGKDNHSAGLPAACTVSSSGKALFTCTTPPDAQLVIYDLNRIEKSTSEWQLKGKRNSRQMSKKQEARRFVYGEEANNSSPLPPLPTLFEVKIEVKPSSNKPCVPLVSRMSELHGKAIVGHPVSVEALDEYYCNGMVMSQAVVKANSLSKKKGKSQGGSGKSKKKSSSVSIKTRRLSTLTSQRLTSGRSKVQTTGKAKETVVACIPLKVVFSRINQVLKGSARQTQHRALPSAGKP